ncbi:axin-1 [Conger conger]|uniref:axin-1 n=1 Tax=Conger conger TaxID=82655 RepID=UPI002A598B99|nr:axin-1 [Conger conger]
MSARAEGFLPADLRGGFTEDAPRPPVPGEEGELVSSDARHSYPAKASVAMPRRPDLDLGYEPEGSASPTPPCLKWAESLHSLLDDQDGIHLFRAFLEQERCADLLDFWFACSGFRKLEAGHEQAEEKKQKLAKAIYRKYILDNGGIVSRQIKPATKSFIRDCVTRLHIDLAMFDQAQTEIQAAIEENTYPLFLKSDTYLEYAKMGGESPKPYGEPAPPGSGTALRGYLPTLNEDEEWRSGAESGCDHTATNQLTQQLLMELSPQRVGAKTRCRDSREYRQSARREPPSGYYANAGYAVAPPTSANDSERQSMSSEADTLSLTDTSLDGIPPYRPRKPNQRELHESAKTNGQVPLTHIPRTLRMPKNIHVEPERFAAELIGRLESVLRDRQAQEQLEERLQRVRLEEEGEDAEVSVAPSLAGHRFCAALYPPHRGGAAAPDAHEEDPESILDEHVQRVMKTPDRQSPVSGSPRGPPADLQGWCQGAQTGPRGAEVAGAWHHRHGHRSPREPQGAEAAFRGRRGHVWPGEPHPGGYADGTAAPLRPTERLGYGKCHALELSVPPDMLERNQKIVQWMMEGEEKAGRHKKAPYGGSAESRRSLSHEVSWPASVEHPWVSAQARHTVQPSHPFIQDPTMPPNPAPNPLTQLEEARRRLEEERRRSGSLQTKQRYVMEVIERGRAARPAVLPPLSLVPAVSHTELSPHQSKSMKRVPCENMVVAYYFCGEPIPYRTSIKGSAITLSQFKELLTKKGNYRYYFKKVSDEFDCGVVFEEVREDTAILPIFEEKIIGKVEKVD